MTLSPQFLTKNRKYNISIVPDKIVDFKDGLDYLLKKYESVLVEAGPTICGPYLEDPKIPSPFDYIVLSVFSGKVLFNEKKRIIMNY